MGMRILYAKANRQYRKEFQVVTTICEKDGVRYAIKEAALPEAEQHIRNMFENRDITYKNLKLCPCTLKEGKLWFEYIDGIVLTSKFMYAIEKKDKRYFYRLIDQYMRLLEFDKKNLCEFDNSSEFQKVFGNAIDFLGCKATKRCAFDCTTNNIIIKNDEVIFIDYEWCYNFPIPYDLLRYHCLCTLYSNNQEIEKFEPFINICKYLGLEKLDKLFILRNNFLKYILGEPKKNIADWEVKQKYLKQCISLKHAISLLDIEYKIKWYEDRLKETDFYIKNLENTIQKENTYIESLNNDQKLQQEYIQNLEKSLCNQNAYTDNLEKDLKKQAEYIANIEENLKLKEEYVTQLLKNIHQQNEYIQSLEMNLKSKEECVDDMIKNNSLLKEENQILIKEMSYIENSFYWKIINHIKKNS